jgi:hypothetical protein
VRVLWNCESEPARTAVCVMSTKQQGAGALRTLHDLEVAVQRLLQHRLPEEAAVGDVAHKQLDHGAELVHSLIKAGSDLRGRRPPDRLLKVRVRIRVVQLHGADATDVVVVSGKLGVSGGRWEGRLADELVRLVI